MTMCRMALLLIWLGTAALSRSAEPEAVQDPAPPKVSGRASNTTPPPLKAYVRVKKGTAAKSLSKEAKTHAWTGFLGPTRDGISTETHLLKTWPKAGRRRCGNWLRGMDMPRRLFGTRTWCTLTGWATRS